MGKHHCAGLAHRLGRPHQLGEAKREIERLARVEAQVAQRRVAVRECSSSTATEGSPRHSVTSRPVYSKWMPPGQAPSISAMIASKRRVLYPAAGGSPLAPKGLHCS